MHAKKICSHNRDVSQPEEALHFLERETQFHLGFLPTEQSHSRTRNLDTLFSESTADGLRCLQQVDRDIEQAAPSVFAGVGFEALVQKATDAVLNGGRIVFSGCGATGRLCILLESMWRRFFFELQCGTPSLSADRLQYASDRVCSIMTGGDYALIRSVENFEDYVAVGRRQADELGLAKGDVLVAITEGGETTSVLATVEWALEVGAPTFLLFNNPKDVLAKNIERSRKVIEDARVTVLELYSGPMAVAGSTRMQATTFEMLVAGAALEQVLIAALPSFTGQALPEAAAGMDYARAFGTLLDQLGSDRSVTALGEYVDFEYELYRKGGFVTYFADTLLLDVLTDTTERAPTFSLPPFRKCDDQAAPSSWAFVKNPLFPTPEAWHALFLRSSRCLEWDADLYRNPGMPPVGEKGVPRLRCEDLHKFLIGNEADASRLKRPNAAVMIVCRTETRSENLSRFQEAFAVCAAPYETKCVLGIGMASLPDALCVETDSPQTPLALMEHLAVKLVLNTVSTASMILYGRVSGNWMSHVELTNKKLIDRSIRLIEELGGVSYRDACFELFAAMEERKHNGDDASVSPVQQTLRRLQKEQLR